MKKAKIAQAPRGGHPPPPYGGLESLRGLQLAETSRFSLVDICQPCQLVTPSGSSTCLLVAATNPRLWGGSSSAFPKPPADEERKNRVPRRYHFPDRKGGSQSTVSAVFAVFADVFFHQFVFEARIALPKSAKTAKNAKSASLRLVILSGAKDLNPSRWLRLRFLDSAREWT